MLKGSRSTAKDLREVGTIRPKAHRPQFCYAEEPCARTEGEVPTLLEPNGVSCFLQQ